MRITSAAQLRHASRIAASTSARTKRTWRPSLWRGSVPLRPQCRTVETGTSRSSATSLRLHQLVAREALRLGSAPLVVALIARCSVASSSAVRSRRRCSVRPGRSMWASWRCADALGLRRSRLAELGGSRCCARPLRPCGRLELRRASWGATAARVLERSRRTRVASASSRSAARAGDFEPAQLLAGGDQRRGVDRERLRVALRERAGELRDRVGRLGVVRGELVPPAARGRRPGRGGWTRARA